MRRNKYITYEDVGAYTFSVAASMDPGVLSQSVAPVFITPVKHIFIIAARMMVFASETLNGQFIPEAVFQTRWSFVNPNAPAIRYTSSPKIVRLICKSGMSEDWDVMRRVAAAEVFALVDGANSFSCAVAPTNPWNGIANITIFYILEN